MSDREFDDAIQRSMSTASTLPAAQRDQLLALIEETRRRHVDVKASVNRAMASLDDWRLLQKYMLFDLEARQREAARRNQGGVDPTV